MSWIRIDDKAWSHPKIAGLSGNAVRLWLFGLCWCNAHQTDGAIPTVTLRILGGSARDAKELVAAGLWVPTDSGWSVHDYLAHQSSAEQIRASQEAKAKAGAKGGRRSGEARRQAAASENTKQNESRHEAGASKLVEAKRTKKKNKKEEEEQEEDLPPPPPQGGELQIPCPSPVLSPELVEEIAGHYRAPIEAIKKAENSFSNYWIVGKGAGKRFSRGLWIAKCREWIRRGVESGEIDTSTGGHDDHEAGLRRAKEREERERLAKAEAKARLTQGAA